MMDLATCTQTISDFIGSSSQLINVIVGQSDEDQRHCGIAYKHDNECIIVHLAWHHILLYESDTKFQNYCCILSQLEEHRQYAICAMCDLIKEDKDIPYGIFYQKTGFDKNGKLLLGEGEVGLTCATFVLAAFKAAKIDLIDIFTWSAREDDSIFQSKILSILSDGLKCGKVSQDHFDKVKNDVGCIRFRPEEVAVSSGFKFEDMPVCYDELSKISIQVKDKLEAEYTPS